MEDMLRACVIEFEGSWDTHLPLIELTTTATNQALGCLHMKLCMAGNVVIAANQALGCLHMKLCMVENVEPYCVGMMWVKER